MTREEAIKALNMMNLRGAHPFLHWEEMMEVRDMAIYALRSCLERENQKSLTNADRIRAMSDEELAKMLWQTGRNYRVAHANPFVDCLEQCADLVKWLKQPVEED